MKKRVSMLLVLAVVTLLVTCSTAMAASYVMQECEVVTPASQPREQAVLYCKHPDCDGQAIQLRYDHTGSSCYFHHYTETGDEHKFIFYHNTKEWRCKELCIYCGRDGLFFESRGCTTSHDFDGVEDSRSEATCIKPATAYDICSECRKSNELGPIDGSLNPDAHQYYTYFSDENATCTKYGTKTARCWNMNGNVQCSETHTITDEKQPPLQHDPGPDATCTTDQICMRSGCGQVLVPAGHLPGPAATCTTAQYCLRDDCGEMLAPSLGGHVPGSSATCTTPQVCARGCGYVYKPATGHNYKGMTNKEYTNLVENHDVDGICPNCGESIGYKEAHIYYPNVDGGKKCPCGALNPDYVAPIPDGLNPEDGWVYENGEKSDFTGLYPYNGGLFYILNGQWQRGANGLTLIIDEFWFLANGQVQEHHGFAEYDGEWFYLDGGKLDTTASGVYGYDGKTFLVAAGRLVAECTGLAQIPSGEWYYVAEGRVLTEFSGEIEYDGKTFQIVNGKLAA